MRIFLLTLFLTAASAATFAPFFKAMNPVKNSYIVKVKDGIDVKAVLAELPSGASVKYAFTDVLNGFAVDHIGSVNALTKLPFVEYVEEDSMAKSDVEWGCDRLDQRNLPLDGVINIYGTGAGANIFILDTGIRYTHVEFGGRAEFFWDYETFGDGTDCNGHGTHCAGTAGGTSVGVAVQATVHSVRVLPCTGSGPTSNIIAGLNAVAAGSPKPGVASLSSSAGPSTSLDNAVRDLINSGVPTVVSAGNGSADACAFSPARVATAETVASTTSTDTRSSFSNHGTCVDIFAGGSSIRSAHHPTDTSYTIMSGTSQAAPHVAGAIAVHLAAGRCSSGATCKDKLRNDATTGTVINPGPGTPNRLLYVENQTV
ncbi:aqualysin-1-like [Ptychodera flava]|uniref:aqualysin-1-like n=1 Tax=Ptychodera flava TaxID=63121 RepID=UPI00396A59E0